MTAKNNNEKVFSLRISEKLMREIDRLSKANTFLNVNVPKSKNTWIIEAIIDKINTENNKCNNALTSQIKTGNSEAAEKLYAQHKVFIDSIIKQIAPEEDPSIYIPIAKTALIEAAKSFDEKQGFNFISYAVWFVRNAILKKQKEGKE